ncbi:major facilitator superfamily domain-containing protein [Umbelopsis sp. PMI_123]|nr:major facilitator superfamily domain-containing protein [Umbelopsis sp. PMI_123]
MLTYVTENAPLAHNPGSIEEKPSTRTTDDLKRSSSLFQEPKLERELVKKLDRHILPLICILYCFSFLDRVNIGNAKIGGIEESLLLDSSQFSACLAVFYISYILFEVPANVLLKYFKINVWISIIMLLWGAITVVTAFVTSFTTLVVTRFFLGVFEAGYVPGVMYYLSTFYKRKELATRVAIFLSFNCIAGMISGPIGYASTLLEGQLGMHGWQYLFLIEGVPTTLLSICCYCFLIDDIQSVTWLTQSQKELQIQRISREKATAVEHSKLTWNEFKSSITDWRTWTLGFMFLFCITPLTGISIFLPTLLQELGFSIGVTQLLVIPINLVGAIAEIVSAVVSDRMQRRFPLIFGGACIACMSFIVLSVVHDHWTRYVLLHFAMIGVGMTGPCILTWVSDNWDGPGKAISIALVVCLGNGGGIMASYIFRPSDGPAYVMPFVVFCCILALGAGTSLLLKTYWKRVNDNRDMGVYEVNITDMDSEHIDRLGDRHPSFRYLL